MILKNPKISVIIPVYNAENYLIRCLESVCNQTLEDIEIICVNDCSTDSSAKILQEYSQNYKNFKFINLEKNQGESAARNTGLALAKGEYLAFVDNDDEIDLNFYEKLYEKAKEKNSDIIKGETIEIAYNGQKHFVKQIQEGSDKLSFVAYWWSAIYKRSLIVENKISFPVNHILGGDLLFLNKATIVAKDLQIVNGVYYHYYRREDSGDSKILSLEKIKSSLSIFEQIIDNINLNKPSNKSIYNFIFHHFIIGCFYLSLKAENEETKKLCAKMANIIFNKCEDTNALEKNFSNTIPHLFWMLKNQNISGIEEIIMNTKSRTELIVAGLRARVKKQ